MSDQDDENGGTKPTITWSHPAEPEQPVRIVGTAASTFPSFSQHATGAVTATEAAKVPATKAQVEILDRIGQKFSKMSDRQLFVLLDNNDDIGPQIDVQDDERLIRSCAAFEQKDRDAKRESKIARRIGAAIATPISMIITAAITAYFC